MPVPRAAAVRPRQQKHTLETSALKNCSVPKFGFPSAPLLRRPGTRRARPEGSTPFVNSGCCLLFLSGMATKGGKKEAKPRTFPSRSAETGWTCPRNFGGPGKLASPLTATLGRVLDWCFKCRDTPTPAPWWTPEAADRPRAATRDVSHTPGAVDLEWLTRLVWLFHRLLNGFPEEADGPLIIGPARAAVTVLARG